MAVSTGGLRILSGKLTPLLATVMLVFAAYAVECLGSAQAGTDALGLGLAFARATYPEMRAAPWRFVANGDGNFDGLLKDLRLAIQAYEMKDGPVALDPNDPDESIRGTRAFFYVTLEVDGEFRYISTHGRLVNEEANEQFARVAKARRDRSLAQVRSDLSKAGARFVNDADAVVKQVPIDAWEPFWGKFTLVDKQLSLPPPGEYMPPGRNTFHSFWELLYLRNDGGKKLYVKVEPFEGRVIWVGSREKEAELR
jgi:hypothetical protein